MNRRMLMTITGLLAGVSVCAQPIPTYKDFNQPPHRYFERTPTDRFSRLKPTLESGDVPLDRTGDREFLLSLLRFLGIPASSQMLVFSTTSLQLSLINPANPRALFFSDDLYLGYIPGGRIEVASLDEDLGAVFYIFDIPRGDKPMQIERATRCMNCHAGDDTGFVPGLVVKSVVPGARGGSLDSYRRQLTGHGIPFEERFGGWYVTGEGGLTNHWGNAIGQQVDGVLSRIPNPPTNRVRSGNYPLPTSDLLPQLVHEHQVGFVNRAVEACYRARTLLATDAGRLTPAEAQELDQQADLLTRYLLFADEVALPTASVAGDPLFKADFLRGRREVEGAALKDFDLNTRLFRYRCSYMIYSPVFNGLPAVMKERVYHRLRRILDPESPDPGYAYLAKDEKRTIGRILRATLTDLPADW